MVHVYAWILTILAASTRAHSAPTERQIELREQPLPWQ